MKSNLDMFCMTVFKCTDSFVHNNPGGLGNKAHHRNLYLNES